MAARRSMQRYKFLTCAKFSCRYADTSFLYSTKSTVIANSVDQDEKKKPVSETSDSTVPLSSCPPNTVLTGLNYLKDQPPVLAMPDDQYPPWLWDLLKPKIYPDDGPGGKGEKMRLREANRRRIKEQNFLKTQ